MTWSCRSFIGKSLALSVARIRPWVSGQEGIGPEIVHYSSADLMGVLQGLQDVDAMLLRGRESRSPEIQGDRLRDRRVGAFVRGRTSRNARSAIRTTSKGLRCARRAAYLTARLNSRGKRIVTRSSGVSSISSSRNATPGITCF